MVDNNYEYMTDEEVADYEIKMGRLDQSQKEQYIKELKLLGYWALYDMYDCKNHPENLKYILPS